MGTDMMGRLLRKTAHLSLGSNFLTEPGGQMTGQLFILLVDIPLKTERADEFMALLNDVFEAMKVEETFVSATALRGAEDPDTILLCENWIDRENFMSVQLKRPYRDRCDGRLPELLRSPANCFSSSRSAPSLSRCGKRRSSTYDK
jgi:quinol monooxygenase YgiN